MILRAVKNVLTNLGGVGLGCAAADGVTGWCLLALVVIAGTAARVIGGAIVFIALVFLAVRPLLRRVTRVWDTQPGALPLAISGTFLAVLLAALTTEAIGIPSASSAVRSSLPG